MSQKRSKQPRLSQQPIDVAFSQSQSNPKSEELVQRCVRFFVLNMGTNVPIQRTKIIQQVFKEKPGKMFDKVIKETTKILDNIYGINLQILDNESSTKKYILTSSLEYPELVAKSTTEKFKSSLIFFTLAHIFMSKGICTEKSLWDFLAEINIAPGNINGVDVQTFVTKTLVKEQILNVETVNAVQDTELNKSKFSWGPVAEQTVSKKAILKFYSQMYDGMNVKGWAQFEEALQQFQEPD